MGLASDGRVRTFIFSYILERKGEARVFSLDDAHLSECALAHDAQQAEVVEVDWGEVSVGSGAHCTWRECSATHLGR